MSPDQRAEALRQKAVEARALAAKAHADGNRSELLSLAAQFDRLADEIDRRDSGFTSDLHPEHRDD